MTSYSVQYRHDNGSWIETLFTFDYYAALGAYRELLRDHMTARVQQRGR